MVGKWNMLAEVKSEKVKNFILYLFALRNNIPIGWYLFKFTDIGV